MNEHSSRSHAIFTITIECSEKGVDGNMHVRMGKLHLVDLAVSRTSWICPTVWWPLLLVPALLERAWPWLRG